MHPEFNLKLQSLLMGNIFSMGIKDGLAMEMETYLLCGQETWKIIKFKDILSQTIAKD